MTIKELFDKAEGGTLTYEQFQKAVGESKFVDLTEGNYVSKQKHESEIRQKDQRIEDLNGTVAQRDEDLQKLQNTLKEAGDLDALKKASEDLAELQTKYDNAAKEYTQQLKQQEYEFAVKDFAGSKNFTSNAAKRDFVQAMIAKNLKLEDGNIIGAEDFVKLYLKDNADAFVKKEEPKPKFSQSTDPKDPKKLTLSELMKIKNENPDSVIDF